MPYCQKCGQQIDEAVNNCPFCGEINVSNPNASNSLSKLKKLNFKNIGILLCAIAVIVVAIVFISSLFGGSQKEAIENYLNAVVFADEKALKKSAPKKFWDNLEDEYEIDFDEVYTLFNDDVSAGALEVLENEYGKNIKLSFKITDTERVDSDDMSEIKSTLKELGISKKDITDAVEVEIKLTTKGSEDKDTEEQELVLVKIKGDWYAYEPIGMIGTLAQFAALAAQFT